MWNHGQMPNNQNFNQNPFNVNNARFNPNNQPPLTRNVQNDLHRGNQNFSQNSFNQQPAFRPQAPRPPVWENPRNPGHHQFERQSFNRSDQRSPENDFHRDRSPDFSDAFPDRDFRPRNEQSIDRFVQNFNDERLVTTVPNIRGPGLDQGPPGGQEDLPNKIYGVPCKLVMVNDILSVGVVEVQNPSGMRVNCLFTRKDLLTPMRRDKLSAEVSYDSQYRVNAWLMNNTLKIPYMASTVWLEGMQSNMPPHVAQKILGQPSSENISLYTSVASNLAWNLPSSNPRPGYGPGLDPGSDGGNQRNVVLLDDHSSQSQERTSVRDIGRKIVLTDDNESVNRPWSPMGQFRDQHTNIRPRVQIWNDQQITRTVPVSPAPSTAASTASTPSVQSPVKQRRLSSRSRSRSRDRSKRRGSSKSRGQRSRSRERRRSKSRERSKRSESKRSRSRSRDSKKRKRSRSRTRSLTREELASCPILDQQVLTSCVSGWVTCYVNNEIGIVKLERGFVRQGKDASVSDIKFAFFHADQVMVRTPGVGLHQFGEIYSSQDLPRVFPKRSTVWCNVRMIEAKEASCQALVITPKEKDYLEWSRNVLSMSNEEKNWLSFNLDYVKSVMENTDNKAKPLLNPLSFDSFDHLFEGIVKEYISLDSGLLELTDVENSTVLFNTKQAFKIVIEDGENKWKRLKSEHLKQTDSKLLKEHFPVGSTVKLIVRRIPCSEHSHLKFQAVALFPGTFTDIDAPMDDFKLRYDTEGSKHNLFKNLVRQHDDFKKAASFKTTLRNNKGAVNAVLDGMSDNWYASIVMNYEEDCGLIRIQAKTGVLNPAWSASVNYLYVLFHLDDVYDSDGHQAIRNNCNIRDILNKPVTLTARTICKRALPSEIIETLQEMMMADPLNLGIPVLQAITVQLLSKVTKNVDEGVGVQMPKPTIIRKNTPSLNFKGEFTSCFFQYGLKTKLDIKICNFNAINKTSLPYKEYITAKFDYKEEKDLLYEMKELNSDTSRFLAYGELDLNLVNIENQKNLPSEITKIECKVVYLHRQTLRVERGVAMLKPLVEGVPIPCFAYFQWSDVSKLVAHDYHCKDLAILTPCNSSDTFFMSVSLINSASPIPYVARQIWNENVRVKHGQFEPVPDTMADTLRYRETFIKAFLTTAKYDTKKERPLVKPEAEIKKEVKVDTRTKLQKLVDEKTKENVMIGRVLKLINQNYGLGVCIKKTKDGFSELVQVLFDVFDVWSGDAVLSTLNKKLPNELAVGQFLLVNAISIEKKENVRRNVEFMATAVVGAESLDDLKIKRFPAGAVLLKNADKLDANKINNFKAVVNVVNNMDLDGQEKNVAEEMEQELLLEQKPQKEIKPKGIKSEVADEQKLDVQSSPDLPKSVEKNVKNCENLTKEKEQKLVQEQKPLGETEVKQKKEHKVELTDKHKPEAEVASSPDLIQSAEKNVKNNENLHEQSTSCNTKISSKEIKEKKVEIQMTETDDAQAMVVQAEVNDDPEHAGDADMDESDELMNASSDSSDFEMTEKEQESDISDEENLSKPEGSTSEPGKEEGVSKSVLNGRDNCATRVDVSTEDVSTKEETSDKLDCDNKVSDNLDVSRESIEAALTDMMEAAEDVIKSLESESQ